MNARPASTTRCFLPHASKFAKIDSAGSSLWPSRVSNGPARCADTCRMLPDCVTALMLSKLARRRGWLRYLDVWRWRQNLTEWVRAEVSGLDVTDAEPARLGQLYFDPARGAIHRHETSMQARLDGEHLGLGAVAHQDRSWRL